MIEKYLRTINENGFKYKQTSSLPEKRRVLLAIYNDIKILNNNYFGSFENVDTYFIEEYNKKNEFSNKDIKIIKSYSYLISEIENNLNIFLYQKTLEKIKMNNKELLEKNIKGLFSYNDETEVDKSYMQKHFMELISINRFYDYIESYKKIFNNYTRIPLQYSKKSYAPILSKDAYHNSLYLSLGYYLESDEKEARFNLSNIYKILKENPFVIIKHEDLFENINKTKGYENSEELCNFLKEESNSLELRVLIAVKTLRNKIICHKDSNYLFKENYDNVNYIYNFLFQNKEEVVNIIKKIIEIKEFLINLIEDQEGVGHNTTKADLEVLSGYKKDKDQNQLIFEDVIDLLEYKIKNTLLNATKNDMVFYPPNILKNSKNKVFFETLLSKYKIIYSEDYNTSPNYSKKYYTIYKIKNHIDVDSFIVEIKEFLKSKECC